MNGSSYKLRLSGLGILVISLVALNASAAQAATWMVSGVNLGAGTRAATAKVVAPSVSLLTRFGLNNVTFSCTASELTNANLEREGKVSQAGAGAKVKFTGCTTKINGAVAGACRPTVGGVGGVIETERFSGQLGLHTGGEGVVVLTPKVGELFAAIHMGAACAIGQTVGVFGILAIKDSGGLAGLETEGKIHTFEEFAPLTALEAENEGAVVGAATLDGQLEVELVTQENWNGLPE